MGNKEKERGRDGVKSPSIMLAVQLITCSNQITLTQAYLLHPMFFFTLPLPLSLSGSAQADKRDVSSFTKTVVCHAKTIAAALF